MLSSIGSTSVPIVSDFLPAVYLIVGIALAVFIIGFLIRMVLPHHP